MQPRKKRHTSANRLLNLTLEGLGGSLGRAEGELGAQGRGGLIILDPLDDLGEIGVHNEGALAIVGGREIAAESIELGLNLLVGGIVRNVGLGNLDDELAN